MSHHRDPNAPQNLDAAAITAFEETNEIKAMNRRIAYLTSEIARMPQLHENLAAERAQLYSRKAKRLHAWKKDFIQNWWHSAYDEYISGSEFAERDRTPLFNIYKKYLSERARLRECLFMETPLDSVIWPTMPRRYGLALHIHRTRCLLSRTDTYGESVSNMF